MSQYIQTLLAPGNNQIIVGDVVDRIGRGIHALLISPNGGTRSATVDEENSAVASMKKTCFSRCQIKAGGRMPDIPPPKCRRSARTVLTYDGIIDVEPASRRRHIVRNGVEVQVVRGQVARYLDWR